MYQIDNVATKNFAREESLHETVAGEEDSSWIVYLLWSAKSHKNQAVRGMQDDSKLLAEQTARGPQIPVREGQGRSWGAFTPLDYNAIALMQN